MHVFGWTKTKDTNAEEKPIYLIEQFYLKNKKLRQHSAFQDLLNVKILKTNLKLTS